MKQLKISQPSIPASLRSTNKKNLRNKLTIASMTKDYDKLLGRDDTEKVLVDVTNYFVSMKPIRTLQTIKVKASVA